MEIVGVLSERRPDRLVLGNGIQVFLTKSVSLKHIAVGTSLMISYTTRDGEKLAHRIQPKPDWLLESAACLGI
jgi:hypothetical protein